HLLSSVRPDGRRDVEPDRARHQDRDHDRGLESHRPAGPPEIQQREWRARPVHPQERRDLVRQRRHELLMKGCTQKAVSVKLLGAPHCRSGAWRLSLEADRLKLPAFSLIEVVAAVAIFAIGLVALLGLLTPITKSVANVEDTEA